MNYKSDIKDIIKGELLACKGYQTRLLGVLIDMTDIIKLPECKSLTNDYYQDVFDFFQDQLFYSDFFEQTPEELSTEELRLFLKSTFQVIEGALHLPLDEDKINDVCVEFINTNYLWLKDLHQYISINTEFEVQLPRPNCLEMLTEKEENSEHGDAQSSTDSEQEQIPLFFLNPLTIRNLKDLDGKVTSIEWQREKKYEQMIRKGHDHIFKKEIDKGIETFILANNIKNTAEALTLIGWAYSAQGKIEKAKSFCLKAVKKDPSYGPPYNDMGTYILGEGHIEESLKWFELAKNASEYQNREFPYINAGRAYISLQKMDKAFDEFSKALAIAPFNKELSQTVERLKKSIELDKQEKSQHTSNDIYDFDNTDHDHDPDQPFM